jgi:hypothetical protein
MNVNFTNPSAGEKNASLSVYKGEEGVTHSTCQTQAVPERCESRSWSSALDRMPVKKLDMKAKSKIPYCVKLERFNHAFGWLGDAVGFERYESIA